MVLGCLLIACTNDQEEVSGSSSELSMVSITRSSSLLTVTDDYSPVGLFLVENGEETKSGRLVYSENDKIWRSNLAVTPQHSYAIYGYAPANTVTATISNESPSGATLTFTDLPTVSCQDVCFVVGVQQLATISDAKNIPLGRFSFTGQSQGENFVHLLMDHVYAAVSFQMSIGSEYAQLRNIKIRKLELQTTNATSTATIVLASNTAGASPVQSASYSNTGEQTSVTFFESTNGVELSAETKTVATCYFVPNLSNSLTLVATYDVYDLKGKISERTATNKLPIGAIRGECVNLSLTIEPTYLYVLSEPDLDNPTLLIEN